MGYSILNLSASSFIKNSSMRLPRFQRKQTWGPTDNFKLCISVFKGYPIGVVIINSCNPKGEKNVDWLLDGRQRTNALNLIKDNPIEIYNWAKSFVKFGNNETEEDLIKKFWGSIDEYLQNDFAKKIDEETDEEEHQGINFSFNAEDQNSKLKSLLDLIVLIHPVIKKQTRLEKMFLFDGLIPKKELQYLISSEGEYRLESKKLRKFILDLIEEGIKTHEELSKYIINRYKPIEEKHIKLQKYVEQQWSYFSKCFSIIPCTEKVLDDSIIGVIKLENALILDAQNIFSLVNAGGTALTKEELLSARPFWNIDLTNPSGVLKDEVKKMYDKLEIDIPEKICRWDLGSTFISRIDKNNIIFKKLDINKDASFNEFMALGFKVISAIYTGGINNNNIMSLESKSIDWDIDIDKLVLDLNNIISRLEDDLYFRHLKEWNQSVMSITGNNLAIEYMALLYKLWKEYEEPVKGSQKNAQFLREAKIALDRLIYEYTTRMWTGSSDSRLSLDLKDYKSRIVKVSENEWLSLIDDLATGVYRGKKTTMNTLKGFIYHYYLIKRILPRMKDVDTKYELDHILAQSIFKNNPGVNEKMKDNIINVALLPKAHNIEKRDKRLNEITDIWLKDTVKVLAELNDNELELYSDINNISKLKEKRIALYKAVYSKDRESLLNN